MEPLLRQHRDQRGLTVQAIGDAIGPDWRATWVQRVVANCPDPDLREALVAREGAYQAGNMERGEYQHEGLRMIADAYMRSGFEVRPFPNAGRAMDYAELGRGRDHARRSRESLTWSSEAVSAALDGKRDYEVWCAPIVDAFDGMARVVDGLTTLRDPRDDDRIRSVLEIGNAMHAHYSEAVRMRRPPWLPGHGRHATVLAAWGVLRSRMAREGWV